MTGEGRTTADLIAEARKVVEMTGVRQSTILIDRLADALEDAEKIRRLHEEATSRTVGLAAVIERALSELESDHDFARSVAATILHNADTGEALREVRAKAWDEGERHESDYLNTWGQFCPNPVNPYREGAKTDG